CLIFSFMEILDTHVPQPLELRPSAAFAFLKALPLILLSQAFWLLAFRLWPGLIVVAFFCAGFALYRYMYIRCIRYVITPEIIRVWRGIFFKRTDQVELYRLKDYIVIRPF